MSIWNPSARAAPGAPRARIADRLFVGGCTAAYLVLIGAVLTALKLYGG